MNDISTRGGIYAKGDLLPTKESISAVIQDDDMQYVGILIEYDLIHEPGDKQVTDVLVTLSPGSRLSKSSLQAHVIELITQDIGGFYFTHCDICLNRK